MTKKATSAKKAPARTLNIKPKKAAATKVRTANSAEMVADTPAPYVKSAPAKKQKAGSSQKETTVRTTNQKPRFTGRKLVILDKEYSNRQIEQQAKRVSLSLASSRDFLQGSQSRSMVETALEQADGLVFEKLGIAVVNQSRDEQLGRLTAAGSSRKGFLQTEPERYVYALMTKATKRAAAHFKDTRQATWGIQATNVLNASRTGKGINIAILDTGLDISLPVFRGRVKGSQSFITGQSVSDGNGHGSHCAGIAAGHTYSARNTRYGVAHDANLFIAKVLDNNGEGYDADVFAGIEWAIENNCHLISMSLGGRTELGEQYMESYETAAQEALQNNCLIIAAAGNESERSIGYIEPVNHPANCPSILAVGALDAELNVADFSCGGSMDDGGNIDVAAPGTNIYSNWKNGRYRFESGTSMATPFVAGIAAMLWEAHPSASAAEIWLKLGQMARRLPLNTSDVGAGLAYFR